DHGYSLLMFPCCLGTRALYGQRRACSRYFRQFIESKVIFVSEVSSCVTDRKKQSCRTGGAVASLLNGLSHDCFLWTPATAAQHATHLGCAGSPRAKPEAVSRSAA